MSFFLLGAGVAVRPSGHRPAQLARCVIEWLALVPKDSGTELRGLFQVFLHRPPPFTLRTSRPHPRAPVALFGFSLQGKLEIPTLVVVTASEHMAMHNSSWPSLLAHSLDGFPLSLPTTNSQAQDIYGPNSSSVWRKPHLYKMRGTGEQLPRH